MAMDTLDTHRSTQLRERLNGVGLDLDREQLQLWRWLVLGWTYRQVAERLYVSERTVKRRVSQLLEHLGVHDRMEAAELAGRVDLLGRGRPPGAGRVAISPDPAIIDDALDVLQARHGLTRPEANEMLTRAALANDMAATALAEQVVQAEQSLTQPSQAS